MESHSKIAGHPGHTILITFPIGLLTTSLIFDTLGKLGKKPRLTETAFHLIGAGLLGGLIAAPFGWWDWKFIPQGTRAHKIGQLHGAGNALVLALFGAGWATRRGNPEQASAAALGLSLLGGTLLGATGWLGGEMVDRLGVGVDDGANLDAPNSLSGEPAQ